MSDPVEPPFLKFLADGHAKGGFEMDDILSAFLPLMRQVVTTHQTGMVAPLDGIGALEVNEAGHCGDLIHPEL